MRKCVGEGFECNSWERSFPRHQRQSVSCREMFSLDSPVIYKRCRVGRGFWERRTAKGLSPPPLQTAELLWVNIWWETSVRQQSEPVLAFPFVVSGRLLHSSLIYLRISKNSSNFKGPLMEIWLWEDLRLVFRCENDSEIDHHRLQNRKALRSLGLPLSLASFASRSPLG